MMNSDHMQGLSWTTTRQGLSLVERPRVPSYRVGEPLIAGRSRWPVGVQYSFGVEGHQLTLFASTIHPRIVEDVRLGDAEFALVGGSPVFLLAYRLGATAEWNAVPFGWHLQHPESRAVPASHPSPENRALLWISLVGANDGIIHAQRGVALSPAFTRTLHRAIQNQATALFNPLDCVLALSEILRDEPSLSRRIDAANVRTMANA
ncbi:MAG: hypothetical protein P4L85_03000 [Paludisphaera borealis]|uniref:hypothetical protein n=1 Tax=Paludisphaera borealis TaxID=1387353 RepID=UPI002840A0E8|nr:hypothetical protein [Paludisphaera borealis]MDR3618291.1 hypothetical protein [Paludisphaera borealis]